MSLSKLVKFRKFKKVYWNAFPKAYEVACIYVFIYQSRSSFAKEMLLSIFPLAYTESWHKVKHFLSSHILVLKNLSAANNSPITFLSFSLLFKCRFGSLKDLQSSVLSHQIYVHFNIEEKKLEKWCNPRHLLLSFMNLLSSNSFKLNSIWKKYKYIFWCFLWSKL